MQYKDFPLCHALAAGHANENSIPSAGYAYTLLADHEVNPEYQHIWEAAEVALAEVLTKASMTNANDTVKINFLMKKGYDSAAGGDDDEGDYINIDKKLGIDDPRIVALADSLY